MLMELFSILWMCLILTGNLMSLKSSSFAKSLSALVIPLWLWSVGLKYLPEHHLKHSLLPIFWILISPYLGGCNFFGIWYNCFFFI